MPEEYGGFATGGESDYMGMVVATEELSRGSLGIGGSLVTRPEILTRALVAGGTEEQKQTWLPRIASGELMVGIMVTEPDYGSDVAGVKVTATPSDDGWVVNGVKTWATFAGRADVLMLLARTDPDRSAGHRGLSILIIEKPRAEGHAFAFDDGRGGKAEGRAIDTIGYRGMHSYEVAFDNLFVPGTHLIGGDAGLGRGFYLQMAGFENGRLQTAARAVGLMQAAFEAGLSYAQDRKVFGAPVFDYQLSKVKLARMAALIQGGRQFSYDVAAQDGERRGHARSVDGEGLRVPRRRVGHARSDAAPRRHGLRRRVPGVALLRGRARAVDLRRRRRDALPARDRPPPRRTSARYSSHRAWNSIAVDERVVGDRTGVRGAARGATRDRFATLADVGLRDARERHELHVVDLDRHRRRLVAAADLHLRPAPQPERERDPAGGDAVAQLRAELHGPTLRPPPFNRRACLGEHGRDHAPAVEVPSHESARVATHVTDTQRRARARPIRPARPDGAIGTCEMDQV